MIAYHQFRQDPVSPDLWIWVERGTCQDNSITADKLREFGYSRLGVWLKVPADHPLMAGVGPGSVFSTRGTTLDLVFAPGSKAAVKPQGCECGAAKTGAAPKTPLHSRWCPEFSDAPKTPTEDLVSKIRSTPKQRRA